MTNLLFKSRTGQAIELYPVGLGPRELSTDNFGIDPWALQKRASPAAHTAVRGARKLRKALYNESVPQDLRNRIVDLAVKVGSTMRADDAPQAPGARGGSALQKERSALVGDIMSRGDIPQKIQARLAQLVYADDPVRVIGPAAQSV